MKAVVLSLCILTGVVDTKNDGVVVLEVSSPAQKEVEYVTLTGEFFPQNFKEGEKVSIATFVGEELQEYCQTPL